MKNKTTEYPIPQLREQLRLQAVTLSGKLSRSVARLTSCDMVPCLEYGEEVAKEQDIAQQLFYIQSCRNALERCMACKSATVRYRGNDGSLTRTTFRKVGPARVRVIGLEEKSA